MATTFKLDEITADLDQICHEYTKHSDCRGPACMIGYAKYCAAQCVNGDKDKIPDGFENIPASDTRGDYDEYDILYAISHLLGQCHSCRQEHSLNCILNIVRSCYEVIEFGDEKSYEGTPLEYLMKLHDADPDKADAVLEEYNRYKEAELKKEEADNTDLFNDTNE